MNGEIGFASFVLHVSVDALGQCSIFDSFICKSVLLSCFFFSPSVLLLTKNIVCSLQGSREGTQSN